MNTLKIIFGILFILAAVAIGLYVGIYLCLWGGVVTVVHAVGSGSFWLFVWGVIRFFLAAPLGWGLFFAFTGISAAFFTSIKK